MKECFLKYLKGKTIVIITHALHYLKYMNYIFVFEDGQSNLSGTYEELKTTVVFKELLSKIQKYNNYSTPNPSLKKQFSSKYQEKNNIICLNSKEKQDLLIPLISKSAYDNIILEEDRKKGPLSFKIYSMYLKMIGSRIFVISLILIMIGWLFNHFATNLWLAHWCSSNDEENRVFYLKIYLILALSYGFFSLFRAGILCYFNLKVSRKMHYLILKSLLYAPINEFFDRVPAGRILNRISKDISVVDSEIPFDIGNFIVPFFTLFGDMIFCVYSTSIYMIFPIIFFIFFCFWVQSKYMNAYRELVRLEAISRSPIVSYFNESLSGLSSIRAYNKEKNFYLVFYIHFF